MCFFISTGDQKFGILLENVLLFCKKKKRILAILWQAAASLKFTKYSGFLWLCWYLAKDLAFQDPDRMLDEELIFTRQ